MATGLELGKYTGVSWWGLSPKTIELGKAKPFTKADYKDLDKFKYAQYVPVLFEIDDPFTLLIAPNVTQQQQMKQFETPMESMPFKVEVFTYLYHNRYWRPRLSVTELQNVNYMQINYKGLDRNQLKQISTEYLFEIMFEMAIYHFGYDFNLVPHRPFTDETYTKYKEYYETLSSVLDDNSIPKKLATKKEMRATLLATEYLHYVDFFGNSSPTKLQASPDLIQDFLKYSDYKDLGYKDPKDYSKEDKQTIKEQTDKANVVKTTVSRIPESIMTRFEDKGIAGGQLTQDAINFYKYYNGANLLDQYNGKVDWLIYSALGNKPPPKKEQE